MVRGGCGRFSATAGLAVGTWLSIGSLGAQELTALTATSGPVPVLVELTLEPAAVVFGQTLGSSMQGGNAGRPSTSTR